MIVPSHPEDEVKDDQGIFDALLCASQRRHPAVCLSAKHREGITLEHWVALNEQSCTGRVRFCESACSGDAITRVALVGGYRDDEATTDTPTPPPPPLLPSLLYCKPLRTVRVQHIHKKHGLTDNYEPVINVFVCFVSFFPPSTQLLYCRC